MEQKRPIYAEIRELGDKEYNLFCMDLLMVFDFLHRAKALKSRNKFAMELMITFLLATILKKCQKNINGIGFPCKKGKIEGECRLNIFALQKIAIECSEFDTVLLERLGNRVQYRKIQVVRYSHQKTINTNEFFEFLVNKKLKKYREDDTLHLLVNIEESIHFEYAKLNNMLCKSSVPFRSIVAIGHNNPPESLRFVAIKLYKELEGPIPIDFNKPPPG